MTWSYRVELYDLELWHMIGINLLFPLIMVVVGFFMWKRKWPKKPNWTRGHRTSMSKKNQDTWEFAHRYGGKFDLTYGLILMIPSVVVAILVERGTLQPWTIAALIIVQILVFIKGIILTEMALRKEFDQNGERRR